MFLHARVVGVGREHGHGQRGGEGGWERGGQPGRQVGAIGQRAVARQHRAGVGVREDWGRRAVRQHG